MGGQSKLLRPLNTCLLHVIALRRHTITRSPTGYWRAVRGLRVQIAFRCMCCMCMFRRCTQHRLFCTKPPRELCVGDLFFGGPSVHAVVIVNASMPLRCPECANSKK